MKAITSKNIDVSIIIVNYKSWKHLFNCLNSIKNINSSEFNLEVVVVDNFSNDGNFLEFKKNFVNFNFIQNSANNGFANGCNVGARNSNGEYLLFLNPDTIISREPILKMLNFLKKNINCGIVSCNQKNTKGYFEKNVRFFPDFKTLFGFFRAINKKSLSKEIKSNNKVLYPNWVSGAVVFISRVWFDRVKGWNEDYWMYYEDVDLSKKISDLKGEVCLLTDTEIIHNHGGASRINLKTSSITKTEVLISKHVYINNHFGGFKHFVLQFLVILNNVIGKLISVFLGIIFFFIPKFRLELIIYLKIIKYYFVSIKNATWLSSRSVNYLNKS